LRRVVASYVEHYHLERCHQGLNQTFLGGDWDAHNGFFVDADRFRLIRPELREWFSGRREFLEVYQERVGGAADWEGSSPRSLIQGDLHKEVSSGRT
jgi:hypothetical protein